MSRVAVIDHGAGNLVSIEQGLRSAGATVRIVNQPGEIGGADAVVLPGVGSTGAAMRRLRRDGMDEAIAAWSGPLLGVCVGLQLFFGDSEEADGASLGLLAGSVRRLKARRLPHMGWNDVSANDDPIFAGLPPGTPLYFVHSFAPAPDDPGIVAATSEYEGEVFTAAVRSGNLVGVQFHPERSGRWGLHILGNFVRSVEADADAA